MVKIPLVKNSFLDNCVLLS